MARKSAELPATPSTNEWQRSQEKRRNTLKWFMVLFSTLIVGLWLLVFWAMVQRHRDLVRLAREGRHVSARVTRKFVNGDSDHLLDYAFPVQNQTITGYKRVNITVYRQTPIGALLRITYLPSDPHLQELGTVHESDVMADLSSSGQVFVLLTVFFAGMLWFIWTRLLKPRGPERVIVNPS